MKTKNEKEHNTFVHIHDSTYACKHQRYTLLASNVGPILVQYCAQYWANIGHKYCTNIGRKCCAILGQYLVQIATILATTHFYDIPPI